MELLDIHLEAVIGEYRYHVEISEPLGACGVVHLYIHGLYYGQFVNAQGQWRYYPQKTDWLITEDIQMLLRLIEEADQKRNT